MIHTLLGRVLWEGFLLLLVMVVAGCKVNHKALDYECCICNDLAELVTGGENGDENRKAIKADERTAGNFEQQTLGGVMAAQAISTSKHGVVAENHRSKECSNLGTVASGIEQPLQKDVDDGDVGQQKEYCSDNKTDGKIDQHKND